MVVVGLAGAGWRYRSTLVELTSAVTGRKEAEQRLVELETVTASKDSLFDELMETTMLITDISQAVSAVQSGRPDLVLDPGDETGRPMSVREARRVIMAQIDSLKERLASSGARLSANLDRMREYAGTQERFRIQLADYERRITAMTELVSRQESQLASLGTELTTLRDENVRLRVERDEMAAAQTGLEDQVADLYDRQNTVYWVAGRKDDLKRRGVIVEAGGNIFGGKTQVPAAELPVTEFIPLNRGQETVLTLPNPSKRYKIVSRHNGALLSPAADRDRKVRGVITITDPDAFWEISRYLILVED